MPERQHHDAEENVRPERQAPASFDRRKLFGAGAGVAGAAIVGTSLARTSSRNPAVSLRAQDEGTPLPEEPQEPDTEQAATPTALGPARPPEYDDPTNWPSEGGDLQSTRLMRESTISTETISQLGTAWVAPIETSAAFGALVAPAMIAGDVVYQQDAMSNVHAIDKATGDILWTKRYDAQVPSGGPNGVAVAYGRVYYSVGLGTVHSIDAASGDDVWETDRLIGPLDEGICMAPLVYDNVVYISTIPGSVEGFYLPGQRGVFYALDANDGTVLWYWETVADNLWGHPRVNSGGGLWHPPTVDEQGNIYLSVANAAPFPGTEEWPNTSSRPGDNPYTNYLVSLDIDTGGTNWAFSLTGHDPFDQDHHLSAISTNLEIDGTEKHVILTTGKHSFVVCADAETGEEIWRVATGVHQNNEVDDIPEGEKLEVLPGSQGGNQTPVAYAEGRLFIPMNVAPSYFDQTSYESAIPIVGEEGTGIMAALDATTGETIWEIDVPSALYGGAVVANDVVFSAALDGIVRGWNVETGEQIFTYQAPAGINAPLTMSGDYLFVPAGTALFPSEDSRDPLPELVQSLTALVIGGEVQTLPEAGATPEGTTEEPGTPAASGGTGTTVSAVDIAFEPTELSIAADTDVTITVTNEGVLQHDFVVEDTDFATDILDGGDSAELVVNLPAGEYVFYCSVPGHRDAGMEGTLTVG